MSAIRSHRILSADGLAGLFFLLLGGFFFWNASSYSMGSLRNIGPGVFPALAGGILAVLGLVVLARGFLEPRPVGAIAWRPLFGVLTPVLVFALTLKTLGLAPAAAILVGASLLLTGQASLRTALALSVALAAFAVLVFGVALQMPLKLLPW